jgi:hypothetical protein
MDKCKVNKLQEREPFPIGYNHRPVQLRKLFSCLLLGFTLKTNIGVFENRKAKTLLTEETACRVT